MTTPKDDPETGQPTLIPDIKLVRASILYADEVELLSPAAALIHALGVGRLHGQPPPLSDMMAWASAATGEQILEPEQLVSLRRQERGTRLGRLGNLDDRRRRSEIEEEARRRLAIAQDDLLAMTGARELSSALRSGDVKVASLGMSGSDAFAAMNGRASLGSELMPKFVELVRERLSDGRSRALVDDSVAELVRIMEREGRLDAGTGEAVAARSGGVQVGAGLLGRLPTINTVPVDELIDLRRDLGQPLVRYRAAVADMTSQTAMRLGEADAGELDDLWLRKVAPAIVEIREMMAHHTLVRAAARSAQQDIRQFVFTGPGLFFGVTHLSDFHAAVAAALAAAPEAATAFVRGGLARRDAMRQVAKNNFYYVYSVEERTRRR